MHLLLDATLIRLADLVISVQDEGGGASPELPSLGTTFGEVASKIDLNWCERGRVCESVSKRQIGGETPITDTEPKDGDSRYIIIDRRKVHIRINPYHHKKDSAEYSHLLVAPRRGHILDGRGGGWSKAHGRLRFNLCWSLEVGVFGLDGAGRTIIW